jgi:alkaline phosphatase D
MLFGTGQPGEDEHWRWLESALLGARPRPVALFIHKPPFIVDPAESDAASATIPKAAKPRLWRLVEAFAVRLVACGHRHEYRAQHRGGTAIVWAPTTSGLLDERTPPIAGPYRPGVVEYVFVGETVMHRCVDLAAEGARP